MGVTRTVLEQGQGDQPEEGDEIIVEYTGFLYDEARQCRGQCFDSSQSRRCHFKTPIGVGKVIKGPVDRFRDGTHPEALVLTYYVGWDKGIMEMKLGEKSILVISSDYAYGPIGFPGLIPPDSVLEFEVQLHGINRITTDVSPKDAGARVPA